MTLKPDRCPECGSAKVASILYGLPDFSDELERELNAEEVELGGCIIMDDDPLWHCVECHHRWGNWELGIREAIEESE